MYKRVKTDDLAIAEVEKAKLSAELIIANQDFKFTLPNNDYRK